MKRKRENEKRKNLSVKFLPILTLVSILGLSIGFSAFQETLLVNDMVATVTPDETISLSNVSVSKVKSRAVSKNATITDKTLSDTVVLPESDSSVTYAVEVKTLGNVEQGILDIDVDNEDLAVNLEPGYEYTEKICDDNNSSKCTLGATKVIYLSVGYDEDGYDSETSDDDKNYTLELDFRGYNSVTYVDITGSYQNEVMNGASLEVDFDTNAPYDVEVNMSGGLISSSLYTYTNGVLTIPNVTGDIVITGVSNNVSYTVTYTDIIGTYQDEVLPGTTLTVDFDENAPAYVTVTSGGSTLTSNNYVYLNGVLTIPNVSGNLVITGSSICILTDVKSFGNTCILSEDNDSSNTITKGDKITCGTESFYVIENPSNGKVKMIAEYNLNISDGVIIQGAGIPYSYTYCSSTVGYQDYHVRGYVDVDNDSSLFNYIAISVSAIHLGYSLVPFDMVTTDNYGYWTTSENHVLDTNTYTACSGKSFCHKEESEASLKYYPSYVYDNNATLKTFVDTYVGYLNSSISGANATGRLISTDELVELGCVLSSASNTCSTAPAWVYQTSYWTGSAENSESLLAVVSTGRFYSYSFNSYQSFGVRPVIEISKNAISNAQ